MNEFPNAPQRLLDGGGQAGDALTTEAVARLAEPPATDRVAQERIWRSLSAGLQERSRWQARARWLWVPVGAVAALAVVVVALRVVSKSVTTPVIGTPGATAATPAPMVAQAPSARIQIASGKVLRAEPRQDWVNTKEGELLPEASRVHTEAGRATVAIGESQVLVAAGTDVGLESLGPNTFLRLSSGEVVCQVSHRKAGESFVVQTTRYRVSVRGTIFAVREKSADDVDVSVSRGLVEVTGEGGQWLVPAGSAWHSRSPETKAADDITSEERTLVGAEDAAPALVPPPQPPPSPESPAFHRAIATQKLGVPPHPASPPPGERSLERPRPAVTSVRPSASSDRMGDSVGEPTPVLQPPLLARVEPEDLQAAKQAAASPALTPSPAPAVGAPPPVLARDPYESAIAVARSGDASTAAQALQRVFDSHDRHADLALYELGRLRQQRLADPLGALGAYQTYEKQYPHGALMQEVRLSAIEIQLQQENLVGALREIDAYLDSFGKSERAPEVHLLRGDVLRKRGEDASAWREYRRAADQGTGEVAEEGLYRSAACAERSGDTDAAAAALHSYLEKYPTGRHAKEAATALGR